MKRTIQVLNMSTMQITIEQISCASGEQNATRSSRYNLLKYATLSRSPYGREGEILRMVKF